MLARVCRPERVVPMWRVDILVRSIAFEDAREMAEALAHCVPRERAAAMHVRDAKTLLESAVISIECWIISLSMTSQARQVISNDIARKFSSTLSSLPYIPMTSICPWLSWRPDSLVDETANSTEAVA